MPFPQDFTLRMPGGGTQKLADHQGKVLLLVNTASRCGFTPQYAGLEALWRKHRDAGLVVMGFPCNQFGGQEPGTDDQIASFCTLKYDVTFPLAAKVDVNGEEADPLFQWLKKEKPGVLGTGAIKWNFTKFLVGRDGTVLARFAPSASPASLEDAVVGALGAPVAASSAVGVP